MAAGAAVVAGCMGLALAGSGALAAKSLYAAPIYGNIPNITVRGVAAGAAPWVVKGSAVVTPGHLVVTGTSLVVPPGYMGTGAAVPKKLIGTTVGVPAVGAELTCAQGTSIVTSTAPLTKKGAFKINASVKLPAACTDPIVLVGPVSKGKMVAWFASTDFLEYGMPGKSVIGWGGKASGKAGKHGSTWA